jgi:hypothetical protein
MAMEDLFPPEAIRILRSARWDCGASKAHEALSGGFWWSDELPDGLFDACHKVGSWAFRYLLGFRASLVAGRPREELARPWRQLERECPGWPGFRPERRSPELRVEQEAESRRVVEELESLCDPEFKD